jgi:hypothetical protein
MGGCPQITLTSAAALQPCQLVMLMTTITKGYMGTLAQFPEYNAEKTALHQIAQAASSMTIR